MTPWLSLLGMARRAGAVVIGEESLMESAQNHKLRLVLLSGDAGDTTARRVKRLENEKLPVVALPDGKADLGGAIGFASAAAVGVTDLGLSCAILGKLAQAHSEFAPVAEAMAQRQSKALRRKADTVKHGKKSQRRKA